MDPSVTILQLDLMWNREEELGDILFDTIMLADSHGINPQVALGKTISKLKVKVRL